MTEPEGIRLQKVLAAAGIGSRRACEVLIGEGRVSVNDEVVSSQGRRVDPEVDVIRVDTMRINTARGLVHLAMNKPRGYVTAMSDPEGRPTVGDLVRDRTERLFHVGRLDADTEGLLLLTNDGELAHRLSHPSYEVPKTYLAEVIGPVARDVGKRLREGVELEDGIVRVDSFKLVDSNSNRVLLELVLHEGRKHIVRRALAEVGHPVQRLLRTSVGPVQLGSQKPGKIRNLTREELAGLFALVKM
ncbi:MAG: Ribosomal large subunit pseudouridine synthase B [uncultured Frankineae bacterium]|uniref:Pseudouridine synthase n=1 Tax=uncultured Frankineae bacterium TaxID=437475 RepID=A0A6J4LH39_9ACTN|nr:MAG: Ribosomal large subunit pseudouridine synthase B [uncultured Frankineae bacterium]